MLSLMMEKEHMEEELNLVRKGFQKRGGELNIQSIKMQIFTQRMDWGV